MIVVLEGPAATHGDEPRIPDLGEDHLFDGPFTRARRPAREPRWD
jgi:hypothetical protein